MVETIHSEPTPTIDHYRVRTVVKGVITEGVNEPNELEARTTAQFIVDADPTGNTEAWIIPVMSDRTLGGVLDVIVHIDPSEDTDYMFPDDEPTPTVSVDAPIESASIQTTNTSTITRSILETLDNASQGMEGWISMKMNDGRTVCTDGNDVWFADVGNRVQIDSINLTDTFVSIRFPNDGGVMWLYYDKMVNASLTIQGAN